MQKTKLVTLLKTFSKQEMRDFEKFISSPYFSPGRNLKPLFNVLKKFHPLYDSQGFTEEKVFRKLYPGRKYEKKKSGHTMQVMLSDLTLLAEKFTVYNKFENGELDYYYNEFLAENYLEKNLLDLSLKVFLKNSKLVDSNHGDEHYFYRRKETDLHLSDIFIIKNKSSDNFKYTSNAILYIYAYIFEMLASFHNKYRANKRNFNLIYNGYELVMHFVKSFDPMLYEKECKADDYETKNITLLNYYILKSRIDENDRESVLNAISIYKNIFGSLDRYRQYRLFNLLLNRCIGRAGIDINYNSTGSDLIDFVWSKGVISYSKNMPLSEVTYLSALTIKLSVSELSELRAYVNNYSHKVSAKFRVDIKNISDAVIYFREKKFDKCLQNISLKDSLNLHSFKSFKHRIRICCLFELSYNEEIISAMETFEKFLFNNKKVSDTIRPGNINFLNAARKLFFLKHNGINDKPGIIKEIDELIKHSTLNFWFKEKLDEISCKNPN